MLDSWKSVVFRGFRWKFAARIATLAGMQDGAAIPYQFHIDVARDDIDFMGHVNNASYLKWVQEAVIAHWRSLAPVEAVAEHLWVALKHEITYRRPAFLDDDVVATVLLEKVQGARAFYETIIKRGTEVLAEVKSSWCCLDAATLRPARPAKDIIDRFFVAKGVEE
jgi:acyl-CoA thioester hydrolase